MLSPEYPWGAYWTGGIVFVAGVIAILIVYLRERSSKNKKGRKKGKKMYLLKRILNYSGGWVPPRIVIPNNEVGRNEVSKKKGNKSINRALEEDRNRKKNMKKYRRKG